MSPTDYIDVSSTGRTVDGMLTFFEDPAVDKLFGVVLALSRENYVLADRVRVLEHLLESKGVVSRDEVDGFAPAGDADAEFRAARESYFERLLEPLTNDDVAGTPRPEETH
jgi:hypothetical protein